MLQNREKLEVIGELIENIAHQWRQPLSIISSSASAIKIEKEFDTLTDEYLIEFCDKINNTAQKLSKTIDNFRNYFENSENIVEVNLKDIIDNCNNMVKDSFLYENIKIIKTIDDTEDIIIKGKKNHFTQIILIILSNAKDILETIEDENRYIFIDIKKQNKEIIISIKDNGGGIKDENLSKVFEPYFTTKHKSQGTGLGLYTAYELVKNSLNANLQVENIEYKYNNTKYIGACFTIILNKNKND